MGVCRRNVHLLSAILFRMDDHIRTGQILTHFNFYDNLVEVNVAAQV